MDTFSAREKEGRRAIMVTAFGPFGGEKNNPTEMILSRLPAFVRGCRIEKLLLPVEFVRAREEAIREYDRVLPAAVVMLGQAGGRAAITPETTGRNIMNARIPDNAGFKPLGLPITQGGSDSLRSTLPVGEIVRAVRAAGIACESSDNAGEYVCNALLYAMLEHTKGEAPAGFIHVPFIPEQGHADAPGMEPEEMLRGIEAALGAVADSLNAREGALQGM